MGFTEGLTLVFIGLKILGVITWSWWFVLLPEIIALVLYIIVFIFGLFGVFRTNREMKKHFDELF